MKNTTFNGRITRAANRATQTISAARQGLSVAFLAVLLLLILPVSGCIGVAGSNKAASTTPGAGGISLAPATITFGSVALGETVSQSVTISNDGDSSISITKASATAAGVTITGVSFPVTIAAGNKATFNVVYSPKVAGTLSGNVSVVTSLAGAPGTVSLTGKGVASTPLLSWSTSSLKFGNVTIGKSSLQTVILKNDGNAKVIISKVTVSGAHYAVSGITSGLTLEPGQSATLAEIFAPTSAGSLTGSVTIVSNATNSPALISSSGDGTTVSTPPSTPTVAHSVELAWSPSASAVAGYEVFRSQVSAGPFTKLDAGLVTADSYTDASVQAGQTYYYVVTSVSAAGVQSAESAPVSATIPTT
jgi:hypothetical protein